MTSIIGHQAKSVPYRSWCNDQLSISKPVKQEKLMRSSEIFVSRKHFYCSNASLLQICQMDLMESTQTAALQTVSVNAPKGTHYTVSPEKKGNGKWYTKKSS